MSDRTITLSTHIVRTLFIHKNKSVQVWKATCEQSDKNGLKQIHLQMQTLQFQRAVDEDIAHVQDNTTPTRPGETPHPPLLVVKIYDPTFYDTFYDDDEADGVARSQR